MKRLAGFRCFMGLILILLAGCGDTSDSVGRTDSSTNRRLNDSASRRIDGASMTMVQPVAERTFRTHFRLDAAVSTSNSFVALPANAPDLEQRGQSGDMLSLTPRRKRRTADLRLTQEAGGVVVQVRVMTQRLSTTERAAFATQMGDDRPSENGLNHGGPAASNSKEEWVDWRRDRTLENEIMSEIQSEFTTTQPTSAP